MTGLTAENAGEVTSPGPTEGYAVREFFSVWATSQWQCDCGWVGRCEGLSSAEAPFPIVFHCPACRAIVGSVGAPGESERAAAESQPGVPMEQLDAWLLRLTDDPFPSRRRFPSGTEDVILVQPHDWFFGVDRDWLLGRLLLDPEQSPLDLEDSHGFEICLDDDSIYIPDDLPDGDFDTLLGAASFDGVLVTYGNGGIIGGRYDITGGWIQDWSPEIRNSYIWLGPDPDLHALATSYLSEGLEYWEPNEDELFEVTSPYLDASAQEDVDDILLLAGEAGVVSLNGTVLRDNQPDS